MACVVPSVPSGYAMAEPAGAGMNETTATPM